MDTVPDVRLIRVYAVPYAYAPNGLPLYVEYSGEARGEKRSRPPADETAPPRKSRLVWNDALHSSFLRAVHTLGVDVAVPKQIMHLMGVRSLTREHVASHLQKYRQALRRERERKRLTNPIQPRPSPLTLALNREQTRLPPLRNLDSKDPSTSLLKVPSLTPVSTSAVLPALTNHANSATLLSQTKLSSRQDVMHPSAAS